MFGLINNSLTISLEKAREVTLNKVKTAELKTRTWFLKTSFLSVLFLGLMTFSLKVFHRKMLYLYVMQLRGNENINTAEVFDFLKEKNKRKDYYDNKEINSLKEDRSSEISDSKKIA